MLADVFQRSVSGQIFNDFFTFNSGDFTDTNSGSTPPAIAVSAASGNALDGWLQLTTHASANDYRSLSFGPVLEFVGNPKLPLAVEARLKVNEAAANSSSWYFGLTDTLTTGFLASTGLPPASFHGAVIFKPHGSNVLQFLVSNGTTQSSISNIGTFNSNTPVLLTIGFDPGNGTLGWVLPQVGSQADLNLIPLRRQPLTIAGMTPMYLSAGIVASTSAAETLQIDYWGADFYRN